MQLADLDVVEADVVGAAPAEGQAVVVDDLHAVGLGVGLDLAPTPESSGSMTSTEAPLVMSLWASVSRVWSLPWAFWTMNASSSVRPRMPSSGRRVELDVAGRGHGVGQDHRDLALAGGGERLQCAIAEKSW